MSGRTAHHWIVMKFGGTSVSSADCWYTIAEQARQYLGEGKRVLIVVSALSGVTTLLSRLGQGVHSQERGEILDELDAKHRNLLDSLGLHHHRNSPDTGTAC